MNGTFSFDLVDEPWLPCIERQERRPVYLSLRETLKRAHQLRELVDASPLVTAALHRLLLALLHRIVGPPGMDVWLDLWRAGRWEPGRIDAYLENWRFRFDLFHPERPFYQTTSVAEEYATTPATKLLLELASGNNATLFDHTLDEHYRPLDPAQAARTVVTFQAFAPAGFVSSEKGQSQHRSANAAPLAKGAVALVRGDSLFETLQLNLVRYAPAQAEPPRTTTDDRPEWESEAMVVPEDRAPFGHLDYLTWQSRRIRLVPELDAAGRTVVRRAAVMKGRQLPEGRYTADYEQMLTFKRRDKAAPGQEPYLTIGFSEDRVLWRDSQALLDTFSPSNDLAPRTVQWLHEIATTSDDELEYGGDRHPSLDLLGLTGDRAKLLFWRHERLPLPVGYLRDRFLLQALERAIGWAEEGGEALRRAINRLATLALVPDTGQGGRQPDRKLVGSLAAHLDAGRTYWSALEAPFKRLMLDLSGDPDPDGQPGYGNATLPQWRQQVRRTVRASLLTAISGFDLSGRTLKATAVAERDLEFWLVTLMDGHQDQHKEVVDATN